MWWRALNETLGHWAYWGVILAILLGALSYWSWRDAQAQDVRKRKNPKRRS